MFLIHLVLSSLALRLGMKSVCQWVYFWLGCMSFVLVFVFLLPIVIITEIFDFKYEHKQTVYNRWQLVFLNRSTRIPHMVMCFITWRLNKLVLCYLQFYRVKPSPSYLQKRCFGKYFLLDLIRKIFVVRNRCS